MKIQEPQINKNELHPFSEKKLVEGELYEKMTFTDADFSKTEAKTLSFEQCIFRKVNFEFSRLKGVSFRDVIFESCNLSNVDTKDASFLRVSIQNTRMTGFKIIEGSIGDCLIAGSKGDYLQLRFSKIKNLECKECLLTFADFQGSTLKNAAFDHCDLNGAQFLQVKGESVDVAGSRIEGIQISSQDIKGFVVDVSQALYVSGLLGITVKGLGEK